MATTERITLHVPKEQHLVLQLVALKRNELGEGASVTPARIVEQIVADAVSELKKEVDELIKSLP